jgi:hypothetical protein
MKPGDQRTFLQIPCLSDSYPAHFRPASDSITLNSESVEILSIILEQLADFPSPQRGALLLSGDFGVDRSSLLHFLERLLANPDSPVWDSLLQYLDLSEEVRPLAPVRSLFVQMPLDSSADLDAFLVESFQQSAAASPTLPPADAIAAEEFSARMRQVVAQMAKQSVGMVVLENISERIEQLQDAQRLQDEMRVYRILSEIFSRSGILTILVGREEHLNPEHQAPVLPSGGEESDRNYSWIEFSNPTSFALPQSAPRQEEEFHERLQLLLYGWIQAEIPSWQPERSPRYKHNSQALAVAIPEGGKTPAGLVYFKSVFDPYWSDGDLVRLEETAYPWILMVLNPCERFYEFETRLKEIASRLQMLMIWRPDTPSKTELESLRSMVLEAPGLTTEVAPPGSEALQKIRPILVDLYIGRGHLIEVSGSHAICDDIQSRSISQYLSDRLSRLPMHKTHAIAQGAVRSADNAKRSQALHWAALLADRPELRDGGVAAAQKKLMEWWINSVEGLPKKLQDLPQAFRTTRFWSEIKYIEGPLQALRPVFHSLNSGAFSFFEAIDHIGRNFAWEEDRLSKWKQGLKGLSGLAQWLPAFVHAQEYLSAAFLLDRENMDYLRESLLQSIDEPYCFLEAKARNAFDEKFLQFKKGYSDLYYLLHEDIFHVMSGLKKDEIKIDPVLLRNLDLLSGLQYTDKSYLNRVKLLARWIQRNQCNLPLRQILERYPRCYCNFNPSSNQQPAGSAAQINGIIQDGIEYFRRILRRCGYLIMEELKTQPVDDNSLRQITAALSDGPMIPLKPHCIKVLNGIISKYPNQFLAEIRKGTKPRFH